MHVIISVNNSVLTQCATGNLISVSDRGSNADYSDEISSGLNVKCFARDYAKPAGGTDFYATPGRGHSLRNWYFCARFTVAHTN